MQGRRVCFSAPREVTWEDITIEPDNIKSSEMVVQTKYTLISAAAEAGLYSGSDWNWGVQYPRYPGYTNIGVVTHAGREAEGIVVGDLVFSYKNHTSHTVLDVNKDFHLKVPEGLDPKHALFARLGSVAMTAPTVAIPKPGDYVLVFGLGLIGNLTSQLFSLSGTTVLGVDLYDSRLDVARQCGISHTIKYDKDFLPNKVQTLTDGRGVEIVIDAIGNTDCVVEGLDMLRHGGQILLLGHLRETSQALADDMIRKVFLKWASIKSSWEWQLPQRETDQVKMSIESNSRVIFRMLQDGRLHVEKLISHIINPDGIQDAYEGLINQKNDYWGVVLDWT